MLDRILCIINVSAQSLERRNWRLVKYTLVFWLLRTGKRLKRQLKRRTAKAW